MEVPLSNSTSTESTAEAAQRETNPDLSATVASLVNIQSVSISSVPIFPASQAISIADVTIVATIVQNKNYHTGAIPSSENAQVIVRRQGQVKMII